MDFLISLTNPILLFYFSICCFLYQTLQSLQDDCKTLTEADGTVFLLLRTFGWIYFVDRIDNPYFLSTKGNSR